MDNEWYGWIPILSHELLAENRTLEAHKNFKKRNSDTEDLQEIDVSLAFTDGGYGFLSSIELDIPEVGTIPVSCQISETGLVRFNFSNDNIVENEQFENITFNRNLAIFIFDIIRDVYHNHVHHERTDDCRLTPVKAKDEADAIRKIFLQYQNKIFFYHMFVKVEKIVEDRLSLIQTGLGEFVYAKSFLNLHRNHLDNDYTNSLKSFECASESLAVLRERLSWDLTYESTKAIEKLASNLNEVGEAMRKSTITVESLTRKLVVLTICVLIAALIPIGIESYKAKYDNTEQLLHEINSKLGNLEQAGNKIESFLKSKPSKSSVAKSVPKQAPQAESK